MRTVRCSGRRAPVHAGIHTHTHTHTHTYVADGNNKLFVKPLLPVGEKEGGKRALDEDGGGDDEGAGADPAAEGGAWEEPDAVLSGVSETLNSVQTSRLITYLKNLKI